VTTRAISGPARVDTRVDRLLRRTTAGDIVVLNQTGIDERLARDIIACRPAAVVNVQSSTDATTQWGALHLLRAGIHLLDDVGENGAAAIVEGVTVTLAGSNLLSNDLRIATGNRRTSSDISVHLAERRTNEGAAFIDFADQALQFVVEERTFLGGSVGRGADFELRGKNVVIVDDGPAGAQDLRRLGRTTLAALDPFLIGIGSGADALIARRYKPDLIMGAPGSLSPGARQSGAAILTHVEQGGEQPGEISGPCSTGDLAVLLAHEGEAAMILLARGSTTDRIGTDTTDAASFAVKARVGLKLVDVATIIGLQGATVARRDLAMLVASALFVLIVLGVVAEPIQLFLRGFWLTFGR